MNKLFFVFVAIAAATAGLLLSNHLGPAPKPVVDTDATVFQTVRPLPEMALVNHLGLPFTRQSFEGQWTLLFFGFTHCPDVCPTTLFLLSQVQKATTDLPPSQQPKVAMISVDPARDTPEKLAGYLPHFGEDIVGATGEIPRIQALTASLGVAYSYTPDGKGGYTVDHTASIFLISPRAELKALFTTPHDLETIVRDFEYIVESYDD